MGTPSGEPLRFLIAALTANPAPCPSKGVPSPMIPDWPYAKRGRKQYPVVGIDGRQEYVHVVVCTWYHGPRPEGMVASHLCGNGHLGCFVPADLAWQTWSEDTADRRRHGTIARHRGEASGNARLTWEQVGLMREELAAGATQWDVARRFGVSQATVSEIKRNRRWVI